MVKYVYACIHFSATVSTNICLSVTRFMKLGPGSNFIKLLSRKYCLIANFYALSKIWVGHQSHQCKLYALLAGNQFLLSNSLSVRSKFLCFQASWNWALVSLTSVSGNTSKFNSTWRSFVCLIKLDTVCAHQFHHKGIATSPRAYVLCFRQLKHHLAVI